MEIPHIDICGEGCATGKLINVTEQIVKEAKIIYQNIWVVFDKDDFEDFDKAIKEGLNKGYNIAWSNQSFEYWLNLILKRGNLLNVIQERWYINWWKN